MISVENAPFGRDGDLASQESKVARFAILKRRGGNIGVMTENVTYVEATHSGAKIHFAGSPSIEVDDDLTETLKKLHRL